LNTLLELDRRLFLLINGAGISAFWDILAFTLSWIGEGYMLAIIGCVGLYIFDRKRFPKNFIVFALILLLTGGLGQLLKQVVNKPRPVGDAFLMENATVRIGAPYTIFEYDVIKTWSVIKADKMVLSDGGEPHIHIVGKELKKRGFPSGHTAAAFGFAVCLIYGFKRRWRYLWLIFAGGVAWSRVYVAAHFPLDLLGGFVVGVALPYWLLATTEKYHGLGFRKRPYDGKRKFPVIAIVAGEASGDAYGANLIKEIKKQKPDTKIFGIGGQKMGNAGLDSVHDSKKLSIVGFTAVITAIFSIRKIYKDMLTRMRREDPQVLVCIDLPDFNLMLAAAAQNMGTRVLYYISPQVWAWRTGRVYTIAHRVDRMIIALPFEKKFYEKVGLDTRFYGHPLLEILKPKFKSREEACDKFGLDPKKKTFILAPGSRRNETKYLARDIFRAGAGLAKKLPDYQFAVPLAPNVDGEELGRLAKEQGFDPIITSDDYPDLCNIADFGIITSGTATLEAALFDCPMIIVYKGHKVNIALGRKLVKIDSFGLPNIVAGKKLFPELLQDEVNGENLCEMTLDIILSKENYSKYIGYCRQVKNSLSGGATSELVAKSVLDLACSALKNTEDI